MDYEQTLESIIIDKYQYDGVLIDDSVNISKRNIYKLAGIFVSENPSCIINFIKDRYADESISDYLITALEKDVNVDDAKKIMFCESFTEELIDYICEKYIDSDIDIIAQRIRDRERRSMSCTLIKN